MVARALDIPYQLVHVTESSTATVSNAIATAGSMSTDMYGMVRLYGDHYNVTPYMSFICFIGTVECM